MSKTLGEFEQIAQLMAPLAEKAKGAFALKDDGAVFSHRIDQEIVVTTDTLIAGVHFFATDDPFDIAVKLLAVNLSDLAAMGACPLHYTLNASYPQNITNDWISTFAKGLAHMQERFGISLLGGDTTKTPGPLTLSLSAFGLVKKSTALRRNGAGEGDLICVSGTIGDGALGLKVAKGDLEDTSGYLLSRYLRPSPRIALGQSLIGLATACMDISDGLLGDFNHLGCGGIIHMDKIPLSAQARQILDKDSEQIFTILNGGDDYELLFCIDEKSRPVLEDIAHACETDIAVIGRITKDSDLSLLQPDGTTMSTIPSGYRHF
ncbi:MAG: thiamine-phosphate kinase [Methylocystaceae bacterium]|nr:thiamine-phosphate kinase [Methylocystaceae bacterium]